VTSSSGAGAGWRGAGGAQIVYRVWGADARGLRILDLGTGATRVLTSGTNDGHAVWNYDGRILYNSGMYGVRQEAALYDNTFQPYGQIFSMKADGSDKRSLTDSQWEDSMPLYLTQDVLSR
jgi:Tol biopolymer transport system component